MWHKSHRLLRLSPFFLVVIFIKATDGSPLGTHGRVPRRNPIFRFTVYNRENVTNFPQIFKQPKSFGIKYDFVEINKIFNRRPKSESFSTLLNDTQKQQIDIEKDKLNLNIDEEVLYQIFKEDYNTETTTDQPTTSDIDFTTEYTTTFENYTGNGTLDERFGGGLAAQHAAASLIG